MHSIPAPGRNTRPRTAALLEQVGLTVGTTGLRLNLHLTLAVEHQPGGIQAVTSPVALDQAETSITAVDASELRYAKEGA